LMMALTWTYFPPTCWMTSAYWLSAPTAMIVPSGAFVSSAKEGEQPAASRAAPARAASAASLLQRYGMAGCSHVSFGVSLLVMIMILNFNCNASTTVRGRAGARGPAAMIVDHYHPRRGVLIHDDSRGGAGGGGAVAPPDRRKAGVAARWAEGDLGCTV